MVQSAMRRDAKTVAAWDFDRIIPCHGVRLGLLHLHPLADTNLPRMLLRRKGRRHSALLMSGTYNSAVETIERTVVQSYTSRHDLVCGAP